MKMIRELQPGYVAQRKMAVDRSAVDLAARTARLAFSSEQPYRRWWGIEILDHSPSSVRTQRLQQGLSGLVEHDPKDLFGITTDFEIGADRVGRAVIKFGQSARASEILQDMADGIRPWISVGYVIHNATLVGKSADGVEEYRVDDWEPMEISSVSIPADAAVGLGRSHQPAIAPVEEDEMTDTAKPAEAAPAAEAEQTRSQPAPAPTAPSVDHSARAAEIVELAAKHGFSDSAPGWIRSNASLDQVRASILSSLAERDAKAGGHVNVRAGEDQVDKTRAAVTQALLARGRGYDPDTKAPAKIDHGNEYRGFTLMDLARDCLERAGVRHRGLDIREVVKRAFTQGNSDFPVILENTMHKSLQAGYAITPDTWSRFCATGSVTDFREHNRYGLGSLPNLLPYNEHGEYQNVAIPDGETASIAAGTKGFLVNLTREVIINDDMGALVGIPTMMGRSAARTIEADVYAYLASNPTVKGAALFSDARRNLIASGATAPRNSPSAPTVAAVQVMRQAMAAQLDISGNDVLDLRPSIFVGSLAYGVEMRVVNEAQFDPTGGTKDTRPNVSRGLIRDIVETSRITTNRWYFFADPNEVPTIEVAFLNGVSAPFLDSEEGFTSDGVRMKVRLDFGIRAVDWRGAIRNDGA